MKPLVSSAKGFNSDYMIAYDSATETLEPLYFWLLDLMNDFGLAPEKLIDNFSSSPGSGHFGELGTRATAMQNQAQNMLGQINTVLRSTLNIIYDLKEFKIRLQSYEDIKSDDEGLREAAKLSLKQIWLDKVDMQKGNSGIKAMALGQAGFQTLLDAFLVTKDEKHADTLDLNERVKRIVKSRIVEFNVWLTQSEEELRKRYELEKTYLRSQVNSLKLYSRWAKPYLKAATELEQKDQGRAADLVKTFNTIILELTLFGKHTLNPMDLAKDGTLPQPFEKYKGTRKYHSCVLIDFKFRGIPQRVSQGQAGHYAFGGRTEIRFRAYSLNDDELEMLYKELDKSDLGDILGLIEGTTTESLDQLEKDINEFLEEKTVEEVKAEKKKSESINPFLALIGKYEKPKEPKKSEEKKEKKPKKENWQESEYLRPLAGLNATSTVFSLYDIYKKGHRMPSFA